MTPAPIPADDDLRLQALHALLVLDTPPEQRFDRLVAFIAEEFDVPMALVSLVDWDRQWFKARVGLDAQETCRRDSFCGHALQGPPRVLLVENALLDPRFHDNPLVLGPPHIRFYAGAPLVLPGGAVAGTLCVLDTRPRRLDATDLFILAAVRDLAVAELTRQQHEQPA